MEGLDGLGGMEQMLENLRKHKFEAFCVHRSVANGCKNVSSIKNC